MLSKKDSTFLLLLGFLVLLLRIPYSIEPFWIIDEASYASIANKLVDGYILYQDGWDNKPPFVYYFYSFIFQLFGEGNMLAIHLATLPLILFNIVLVFLIAQEWFGIRIARYSAAAYVLYQVASPKQDVLAANTEIFLAPAICAGVYLALLGLRKRRVWLWIGSGWMFALSTWIKQPGILFCLIVPAFAFIEASPLKRDSILRGLRRCSWSFAGFLLFSVPATILIWKQGIIDEFVEAVILFNTRIHVESIPLVQSLRMFLFAFVSYFSYHFVPISLGLVGIGLCIRKLMARSGRAHGEGFLIDPTSQAHLLAWFLISALAVSIGKRFYGFYFVLLAPSMSLYIGLALGELRKHWSGFALSSRRTILVFLALGIVNPFYLFHGGYLLYTKSLVLDRLGYPYQLGGSTLVSLKMKLVSRYIEKHTTKREKIFIWGYQPEIYVLSNREFASRFNTVALQTGFIWGTIHQMSQWGYLTRGFYWIYPRLKSFTFEPADTADLIYPGSMDQLFRDFGRSPPELFIDGNVAGEWPFGTKYPIASFPRIHSFLQQNYRLERTVAGYRIYRLRPDRSAPQGSKVDE